MDIITEPSKVVERSHGRTQVDAPITAKTPAIDLPLIKHRLPSRQNIKDRSLQFLRKRWRHFAISAGLVVVLVLSSWVHTFFTTESTDDAFIADHVHMISGREAGTVIEVLANDNQVVKKGDALVRLDPTDFIVQLKIAQANDIKARNIASRWRGNEVHAFEIIQRNTDVAAAADADANLEKAELNLKYATIYAPTDGKIGNRTIETGQQIVQVQPLMALVEQTPWVVANFKESQIAHIHIGQKAKIVVDAINGRTFTGKVDSLAPGSGATFALLPPDNATGNFTKIVQRIPVKIVFDKTSLGDYDGRLAPGMSTEVTVDTE